MRGLGRAPDCGATMRVPVDDVFGGDELRGGGFEVR